MRGGLQISNCSETSATLAAGAEHYGAHTSIPSIWFYGDNDGTFPPAVWHDMFERYRAAGGPAELVAYGRFMEDSHNMLGFPEGLKIWAPKVDAFLAKVGLPNKITHPEYLPVEFPPPSGYAALDDVDAVPYLTEEGRQRYRSFLTGPMPRVFVLSPKGMAASFHAGFDPLGRALSACHKQSQDCQVYAVDDYVSWVRPTAAPQPTHFAAVANASAVPYLSDSGRQGYQKYLGYRIPTPDGAWAASALGADPLSAAMNTCAKGHKGCQLYAVDNQVVWPEPQN